MIAAAWLISGLAASALIAQAAPPAESPGAVAWAGVAALPVVIGVVEVLKRAGLPDRWAGVVALLLGIGGALLFGAAAGLDVTTSLAQGLLVGLAASGAWSTTKSAGLGR